MPKILRTDLMQDYTLSGVKWEKWQGQDKDLFSYYRNGDENPHFPHITVAKDQRQNITGDYFRDFHISLDFEGTKFQINYIYWYEEIPENLYYFSLIPKRLVRSEKYQEVNGFLGDLFDVNNQFHLLARTFCQAIGAWNGGLKRGSYPAKGYDRQGNQITK